ncbi:mitogen-activated protein kinase Hog1p [[Candida] jaroonii]|uniref:Mitogen-activated protein kinase Hog1p n=1 Tax=[Candida] jaroonii TaxID=467808 RepID=A0ACA9YG82_9ASCO|nr:mitogen-activated protein kinase Hog1p [[Candida] jaroonii]
MGGRKVTYNISPQFQIIKPLGQGAYGLVCLAIHKPTRRKVAIKRIEAFENPLVTLRTIREIKLLDKFKFHENVVQLLDIQMPKSINEFNEVYIIEEYLPNDLHTIIHKCLLNDDHVQYFIYQILRGLKYIHSSNVIHRDLKPSNILINEDSDLKICDFGLSRLLVDEEDPVDGGSKRRQKQQISNLTEYVATRWYRAPEIMLTVSNYSTAVDTWSVGCILAEMFTGIPLFPGKDYKHQILLITQLLGNPAYNEEESKCIKTIRSKQFLQSISNYPRLDFKSVFENHPNRLQKYGFQEINPLGIDLLERLLVFDPKKRITVQEALEHPYLAQYHDVSDEPTTTKIPPFEFRYDYENKDDLNTEVLKMELYNFIHFYKEINSTS